MHGRANVPYDRFKGYLGNLEQTGLIQLKERDGYQEIALTDRAFVYLNEYMRVKNFMVAFGLDRAR